MSEKDHINFGSITKSRIGFEFVGISDFTGYLVLKGTS